MISVAAIVAWLFAVQTPAQDAMNRPSSSVLGTVVDAKSNAPLSGVRVELVELSQVAQTGPDGRFTFPHVVPRTYTLTVSTIGYIFVRRRIEIPRDTNFDITIPLAEGTGAYHETVTVAAETGHPPELGVSSASELGSADLEALRGVAGDDPMRALQVLPGAVTGDEFQAQFSVRGSAYRHVGVVIDGVATPLLLNEIRGRNDSGSIAMINSDILDHASLLSGPHPERDGDWLGATVDFDVREGSRDRTQFRGAASGTSASFVLEGPIGASHRGSWLISARKSYVGWLIRRIDPSIDSTVDFADVQSKAVYDIGAHQEVQLLLIGGTTTYDQANTSVTNGLSNAVSHGGLASVSWRYTFGKAYVTERASIVESDFKNLGVFDQDLGHGHEQQRITRTDLVWLPSAWAVEGGFKAESQGQGTTLRQFSLVKSALTESAVRDTAGDAVLLSGWAQIGRRGPNGGFSIGARSSSDSLVNKQHTTPWLLAERTVGAFTFRGGAGATAQFDEIDVVKTAPDALSPEHATSIDGSVEYRILKSVRLQVTAFGRDEDHVLRPASETRVVAGKQVIGSLFPTYSSTLDGRSRGVEVLVQRHATAGLTGWIGYTFAHTRQTDALTGETFDGDFDQRHTLNLFVQQRLSYRSTINAKLRAGSNVPIVGYFAGTPDALTLSSTRNAVRLPPYIRLDFRADRTFTFNRTRATLFLEVVNVLNRHNLRQSAGSINNALVATDFTQREVPIVPSIGMRIEF